MSEKEALVVLEIGTTRTVLAVGEQVGDNRVRLTAITSAGTSGVRKGQITNVDWTRSILNTVCANISDKYIIDSTNLLVTGAHIRTQEKTVDWNVVGKTVSETDLVGIAQEVDNINIVDEKERMVLDTIETGYQLDDISCEGSPLGMSGHMLYLHLLFIHALRQRIDNVRNIADMVGIGIDSVCYTGICAAIAVLTPRDKADGALVIDLGGGTSDFSVWKNGHLVYAESLAVGGDHVSQDIHHAFDVSQTDAESIKHAHASALVSEEDIAHRVEITSTILGRAAGSISQRALNTVVNARMYEIFSIIAAKLSDLGLLHSFSAGVILTGGGAKLPRVAELASTVFGCQARVGTLVPEIEIDPALELPEEDVKNPIALASVAGALLYIRPEPRPSGGALGVFTKMFFRKGARRK